MCGICVDLNQRPLAHLVGRDVPKRTGRRSYAQGTFESWDDTALSLNLTTDKSPTGCWCSQTERFEGSAVP